MKPLPGGGEKNNKDDCASHSTHLSTQIKSTQNGSGILLIVGEEGARRYILYFFFFFLFLLKTWLY